MLKLPEDAVTDWNEVAEMLGRHGVTITSVSPRTSGLGSRIPFCQTVRMTDGTVNVETAYGGTAQQKFAPDRVASDCLWEFVEAKRFHGARAA
jgi:hypothetical protein